MAPPQRTCLNGRDWTVRGWVPHEWDLVGPVRLATGGLDLSEVLHGETGQIPASVPGCVQADLQAAGLIDEPYWELNSRACEWAHQRMWVYRRRLDVPSDAAGSRVRLRFEGIDSAARVFVNGALVGRHEGMFIPAVLDATEHVRFGGENVLEVVVEPAPESVGQVGRTSAVRAIKPRFAYKWDFTTRLIPVGLWEGVWLERTGPAGIDECWAHAAPAEGGAAAVEVGAVVRAAEGPLRAELEVELALAGRPTTRASFPCELPRGATELRRTLELPDAQLWWPHGWGEQPVYSARFRLRGPDGAVSDEARTTFGIRRVELLPNAGAPAGARPYTLAVNGRRLFLKGFNWVPVEQMYGTAAAERYAWLVGLARAAGANVLRVWGGGLIETETFYDLCDRAGMLVWQEMPQSSSALDNEPSREPAFVARMQQVARSCIRRRGGHPSLALWGGGNELTAAGEMPLQPLDEAHPCLAAIARAAAEEHPNLPYVPTSPLGPSFDIDLAAVGRGRHHDVHGPWKYQGPVEHYRLFNANDCLFHGETGADGCCSLRSMRRFARLERLWPPEPTNRLWCHHAAWWIPGQAVRALFGEIDDLGRFVQASQLVQAEALRYAVEANRRRWPRCSATLIWQLNEPWPNLACTSNVDYSGRPKWAYHAVRGAFAARHVSLRHEGLPLRPGAELAGEVFVHNDLPDAPPAEATWRVLDPRGEELASGAWSGRLASCGCRKVSRLAWGVPGGWGEAVLVVLELRCGDGEPVRNTYAFCPQGQLPLAPLLALPPARLEAAPAAPVEAPGGPFGAGPPAAAADVRNAGGAVAWMVGLEADAPGFCPQGGATLLPGERRRFDLYLAGGAEGAAGLAIEGWNARAEVS